MPIYGPVTLRQRIAIAAAGLLTIVGTGVFFKVQKTTPTLAIRNEKILEVKSSSGTGLYVTGSGSTTQSGTIKVQRTTDIGWSVVAGANTACNTTCTNACVIGEDTSVLGQFVNCADATADSCLCAGPN